MKNYSKTEVVVIGELNVDIILNRLQQFPIIGKEILAEKLNVTLGSSSAIFASNLSTLGKSVAFIGKIGKDEYAKVVLDSLLIKGVNTDYIIQSETSNTGATVVLNYDQDRAMITYPGAMEELGINDINFNFLATAKHLHISSIFLQPALLKDLSLILKRAKSLGLTISIDPQGDPAQKWVADISGWLPFVDFFMPNVDELLMLTAAGCLEEAINAIRSIAPDTTLVLKNGVQGAYAWRHNNMIHKPAFLNSQTIDCIGAGDSFNAGFIDAFLNECSLEQCLEEGAMMGAISTTKPGGTGAFVTLEAVRKTAAENFGVYC